MTEQTLSPSDNNSADNVIPRLRNMSKDEFVNFMIPNIRMPEADPKILLKEFQEDYANAAEADKKDLKKLKKAVDEKTEKITRILAVETRFNALRNVEEKQHPFVLRMCEELEKEYEAKTYSEKVLVQTAAIAYCRMQEHIRRFRNLANSEYISKERAQYLNIYGKEIDRSNRQFLAALQTLKSIKQPPLKVSVNTKTALIAQNLQNNFSPLISQNNDQQ